MTQKCQGGSGSFYVKVSVRVSTPFMLTRLSSVDLGGGKENT
jgi:hypothetical protein